MMQVAPQPCEPEIAAKFMFGCDGYIVAPVFLWVYVVLIIAQFILSLGNRPQGSKNIYRVIICLWAGIMGLSLAMLAYSMYQVIVAAIDYVGIHGSSSIWGYIATVCIFVGWLIFRIQPFEV
jgi:hypothetical protein